MGQSGRSPINLPPGYFARPATMDDVSAVTELLNAAEVAEWGEPDFTEDELRDDWEHFHGDPGKSITLVVAPDNTLVGYMAITDNGHGAIEADGYSHPGWVGKGIGTWLIQESERMAQDIIAGLPSTQRVTIRSFTAGSNERGLALLENEGYDAIRHFWRMEIEFDGPLPQPEWPSGVRIADARENVDEPGLYTVIETAFSEHFQLTPKQDFDAWLLERKRHGFDPALWAVVWHGDEMIGAGLGRMTGEGTGWISLLGVRKDWRGRGIGRAILLHLLNRFKERGAPSVALGVDAANVTGAIRLYESVGMKPVRNFVLFEKVLREG